MSFSSRVGSINNISRRVNSPPVGEVETRDSVIERLRTSVASFKSRWASHLVVPELTRQEVQEFKQVCFGTGVMFTKEGSDKLASPEGRGLFLAESRSISSMLTQQVSQRVRYFNENYSDCYSHFKSKAEAENPDIPTDEVSIENKVMSVLAKGAEREFPTYPESFLEESGLAVVDLPSCVCGAIGLQDEVLCSAAISSVLNHVIRSSEDADKISLRLTLNPLKMFEEMGSNHDVWIIADKSESRSSTVKIFASDMMEIGVYDLGSDHALFESFLQDYINMDLKIQFESMSIEALKHKV